MGDEQDETPRRSCHSRDEVATTRVKRTRAELNLPQPPGSRPTEAWDGTQGQNAEADLEEEKRSVLTSMKNFRVSNERQAVLGDEEETYSGMSKQKSRSVEVARWKMYHAKQGGP